MNNPTVDMKPDYAYRCGWEDGLAEAIKRFASLRDDILMPASQHEQRMFLHYSRAINELDNLRDFQTAKASKETA